MQREIYLRAIKDYNKYNLVTNTMWDEEKGKKTLHNYRCI